MRTTGGSEAQYAETYEGGWIDYSDKPGFNGGVTRRKMRVRKHRDRDGCQNGSMGDRMRLRVDGLRTLHAVLFTQERSLLVHAGARRGGVGRGRGESLHAIAGHRTGIGRYHKLQGQQASQANPSDRFSSGTSHRDKLSPSSAALSTARLPNGRANRIDALWLKTRPKIERSGSVTPSLATTANGPP